MMDRTLYLKESKGLKVRRDGPSLWILERGKAGRRVPARLISRVVIIGNIRLDTSILMFFAEREIPVMVLTSGGEARACIMPALLSPDAIKERQSSLADDDVFLERAYRWIAAESRKLRLETLRAVAPELAREYRSFGFRDADYHTAILTLLPADGGPVQTVRNTCAGLLYELILQKVMASGLDPHCGMEHRRDQFGLCKDLLGIMNAEADRQTVQFFNARSQKNMAVFKGKGLAPGASRAIIHRFENRRPIVSSMIDRMLTGYFRLLREI